MQKTILTLAAILLAGCGSRGPYSHILSAPEGVDRWEPSGAAVVGDHLWVATDRMGWLAGYRLPLADGENRPQISVKLIPTKNGEPLENVKWEEVTPDLKGGLYLLDSRSRQVWHCADPGNACEQWAPVNVQAQNDDISSELLAVPNYFGMEALGYDGESLWLGSRHVAYTPDELARPFVVISSGKGPIHWTPFEDGERVYALSGFAFDGNHLWQTWSYEGEGDTTDDVSGLLALSDLDTQNQPGLPRLCRTFKGKPEGVAVYGSKLVIVFDMDKARKNPDGEHNFPIKATEDYATIVPAECD